MNTGSTQALSQLLGNGYFSPYSTPLASVASSSNASALTSGDTTFDYHSYSGSISGDSVSLSSEAMYILSNGTPSQSLTYAGASTLNESFHIVGDSQNLASSLNIQFVFTTNASGSPSLGLKIGNNVTDLADVLSTSGFIGGGEESSIPITTGNNDFAGSAPDSYASQQSSIVGDTVTNGAYASSTSSEQLIGIDANGNIVPVSGGSTSPAFVIAIDGTEKSASLGVDPYIFGPPDFTSDAASGSTPTTSSVSGSSQDTVTTPGASQSTTTQTASATNDSTQSNNTATQTSAPLSFALIGLFGSGKAAYAHTLENQIEENRKNLVKTLLA